VRSPFLYLHDIAARGDKGRGLHLASSKATASVATRIHGIGRITHKSMRLVTGIDVRMLKIEAPLIPLI